MNIAGISYQNPLSYTGPQMNTVPIKMMYREPTEEDTNFRIGTMVIIGSNPTSGTKGNIWYLSEYNSSGEAVWLKLDTGQNDYTHLPWTVITTTTFQMEVNNGYFTNSSAELEMSLPVLSNVGDTIILTNIFNGYKIQLNAGQTIHVGPDSSTTGVSGQLAGNLLGDSVTLTCSVANTEWWGTSLQGSLILS